MAGESVFSDTTGHEQVSTSSFELTLWKASTILIPTGQRFLFLIGVTRVRSTKFMTKMKEEKWKDIKAVSSDRITSHK